VIVFAPLAFLTGVSGAFFAALSITMASALVISYLLTAFVVPILADTIIDFRRWRDPTAGREGVWSIGTDGCSQRSRRVPG